MRDLIAGVAADEQHEIGVVHDAVGGRRRVVADGADGERVSRRDEPVGAERNADGRGETFAERQQLVAAARRRGAGTCNDRNPLGGKQCLCRAGDVISRWQRTVRGHRHIERRARADGFGHRAHFDDFGKPPVEIEMRRARRSRHGRAPRLPQQSRQVGGGVDFGCKFRHRRKQRRVWQLLIGVAVLLGGDLAPGQRDDGAAAEIRILQSGGEIGGADGLREAQGRAAGDARKTIGHVDGGFLRMCEHPRDAEHAEFDQCPSQNGVDPEYVRRAGGVDRAREPFGAGHRFGSVGHFSSPFFSCSPSCGAGRV